MKKIAFYILIALLFIPNFSSAQYKLLEPLPCVEGTGNDCKVKDCEGAICTINLDTYIEYAFKFAIALAAFLAVVMIIIGGFQWMVSEIPFVKVSGKEKIWNAIIGLVLVLSSYLILETIDPRLVQINSTVKPVVVNTSVLNNLQTQLLSDISKLNTEGQIKAKENIAKLKQLEDSNKDLDAKLKRGEISGYDHAVKTAINKQEEKHIQADNIKVTAQRNAGKTLEDVFSTIQNTQENYFATMETGAVMDEAVVTRIDNDIKALEINYKTKIQELNDLQEFDTASYLNQELIFYKDQVQEEKRISKEIIEYSIGASKNLPSLKVEYEKDLKEAQAGIDYNEDAELDPSLYIMYEKFTKARLEKINGILNVNP